MILAVIPATTPAIHAAVSRTGGICRDNASNLYFTDVQGNTSRGEKIIAATGIVTTIAGGGPTTVTSDNIPATSAYLYGTLAGVCLDTATAYR